MEPVQEVSGVTRARAAERWVGSSACARMGLRVGLGRVVGLCVGSGVGFWTGSLAR